MESATHEIYKRFKEGPLRQYHELVSTSNSESTMENVKKNRQIIRHYALLKKFHDPQDVCKEASNFAMNFIVDHCRSGTAEELEGNSMNALV